MNNNETEVNSMPYIHQLFLQCQLVKPVENPLEEFCGESFGGILWRNSCKMQ